MWNECEWNFKQIPIDVDNDGALPMAIHNYTYNTTIEQFLICTMHVNELICAKGYSKYLLCQCIGTLLLIRVHIHTSKMEFGLNDLEMELELNTLKMVSHYQNVSKTTCWLWDNRMPKVLPHEMNCDWDEI